MKNQLLSTGLAVSMVLAAVPAFAQQSTRFSYDGRPERLFRPAKGLTQSDSMALKAAAISNMFEIQTSELALKRGSSTWTRQFAKEMIREHTIAHNELRLVADHKNYDLPSGLPADKRAKLRQLESLRGSAFDRKYREIQLMAHRSTSMKLKKHIQTGHDEDVKSYLVKTLPGVNMHLRMAQMQRTMTGPTKMDHNH